MASPCRAQARALQWERQLYLVDRDHDETLPPPATTDVTIRQASLLQVWTLEVPLAAWMLALVGSLLFWYGLHVSAVPVLVWYVAGAATRVEAGTVAKTKPVDGGVSGATINSEPESIRELVPAGLEFIELLEGAEASGLRQRLEPLVGLATTLIGDGAFEHDPVLEQQVTRHRDFLQDEIWVDPEGALNAAIVVPVAEAIMNVAASTLPPKPATRLVEALLGVRPSNGRNVAVWFDVEWA